MKPTPGYRFRDFADFSILWRREKMYNASTSVGCAEMRKHHKIWYFTHLSETGDSPDMFIF